jgi:peptidoglycan/LPS O-acetylase OafA/YrhL
MLNQRQLMPLGSIFAPLYLHGYLAVPFFWALSGFIFFHVYGKRRDVGGWEFFVNRFTRLYPLHLVTLLVVAALQCASWYYFGKFQIYPNNDLKHFLLNLVFAVRWGLEDAIAFNAPVWSVSVEILAYVSFFAYLKAFGVTHLTSLCFLVWALLLAKATPGYISECGALFAVGGFTQRVHVLATDRAGRAGSLVGAAIALSLTYAGYAQGMLSADTSFRWFAFPMIIWLAAALDGLGVTSGRVGDRIGSLSYAWYLVQVPVQLSVVCVLDAFVGSRAPVASPYFLGFFMALVTVVAVAARRFVELPGQRVGRAVLLPLMARSASS